MTMHPKFDDNSSCESCAAFSGWPTRKDDPHTVRGTCHRHAPRPRQDATRFDADGDPVGSVEFGRESVSWPVVSNEGAMFCCEWLPKPEPQEPQP